MNGVSDFSQIASSPWQLPDVRSSDRSLAMSSGYHFWRDLVILWETTKRNIHANLTPLGRRALRPSAGSW